MSTMAFEEKKTSPNLDDQMGSGNSVQGVPDSIQETVLLKENGNPLSCGKSYTSEIIEADNSKAFFSGDNQNSDPTKTKTEGNLSYYNLNEDDAQRENVDLSKKYVGNNRLFDEKPKVGDTLTEDDNGIYIKQYLNYYKTADYPTKTLFIDNKPAVEDISQGNIGDCYFLNALIHIINTDPGLLPNIMSLSGDDVTVKFYKKHRKKWEEENITTRFGLNKLTSNTGVKDIMGSNYRLANEVVATKWCGQIDPGRGNVTFLRRDYHQAAMWVNIMEQAYSLFAKKNGFYGDGRYDKKENSRSARYEVIKGGLAGPVLQIFYGNKVHIEEDRGYSSEGFYVEDDKTQALQNFLKMYQHSQTGSKTATLISVGTTDNNHVISSGHAYAVESVNLVLKNNDVELLSLDPDNYDDIDKLLNALDFDASIVTVRNPHANGMSSSNPGQFKLSLKKLFDHINEMSVADVDLE